MQKTFIVFLCLICLSCSVQKRRYQRGFYLSTHHSKHAVGKNNPTQNFVSIKKDENVTPQKSLSNEFLALNMDGGDSKFKSNQNIFTNDSCDNIIFRDGSEIQGKIIEITSTQIKYKRCDLLNGPLYIIKKSEVFMIKYAGGVREVFKEEPPAYITPPDRPSNVVPGQSNTTVQNKIQITHPKAIRAFINGLLSFISFLGIGTTLAPFLLIFSLVTAIISIVASVKAIKQIRMFPSDYKGKGLAMTGRVLSIIILSIFTLFILLILAFI